MKKKKREISPTDLKRFFRNKRLTCSCGHKFTLHNLSNTIIVYPDGTVKCFSCGYQEEHMQIIVRACVECGDIIGCYWDKEKNDCHSCPACLICVTHLDNPISHGLCDRCLCDVRTLIEKRRKSYYGETYWIMSQLQKSPSLHSSSSYAIAVLSEAT